ncbi:unnamed protein product [Nippostrongylus brasiliensis]|uniref:AN1-type domain-containing protein n=1 Tax=Nippostrongylus brasiliensis TaxID=27835 RepID=A0A0N4Y4D1_NIPBR|nr:unnamed protein product [Nippostrongylus brasiliensis]
MHVDDKKEMLIVNESINNYSKKSYAEQGMNERKRDLLLKNRCFACLVDACDGGAFCRKRNNSCFYYHERGHHPAICPMPEQVTSTQERIEEVPRHLKKAEKRVVRHKERLTQHMEDHDF